jgi:glycerol-3-phosphate dehydrogenase
MAEDVINKAISVAGLPYRACITADLQLHGYEKGTDRTQHWSLYGTDAKEIKQLIRKNKKLAALITPSLPYSLAEVIWAARNEMARSVEDILARRTRILFLDARAAIEAAPIVARILAKELKKSSAWQAKQIREFTRVAKNYLP